MKVFITYDESSSGGEDLNPEEEWSSRADRIYDFRLVRASLERTTKSWYSEEFEIDSEIRPQDVFVVLVRYSSGDTFGSSYGHGHIEGVYFDKDKAMEVAETIENGTYNKKGFNKRGYTVWEGYFESLESAQCYVMRLHDTDKSSKDPIRID